MEITKEEKDFIAKAIECYWDVWNINHPDNEKNANMSKGLVKKLNLQNVSQRSELLLAYHKWYLEHRGTVTDGSPEAMVKMYKANNCG